jgi:hypothetical protein
MTTPSPSEFLTFHRRLTTSLAYRYRPVQRLPVRQFAASSVSRASTGQHNTFSNSETQQGPISGNETGASREHAVDKGEKGDPQIQSYETKAARRYVQHEAQPLERRYTPYLNLRTGAEHFEHAQDKDDTPRELTYADAIRAQRESKG